MVGRRDPRRGVLAGPHEFQWSALTAILQQIVPPLDGAADAARPTRAEARV